MSGGKGSRFVWGWEKRSGDARVACDGALLENHCAPVKAVHEADEVQGQGAVYLPLPWREHSLGQPASRVGDLRCASWRC
jgi:hypothetical protein